MKSLRALFDLYHVTPLIVMAWLTQINPFKIGILNYISLTINILISSLSQPLLWFIKCLCEKGQEYLCVVMNTGPGNRGTAPFSSDTHCPGLCF